MLHQVQDGNMIDDQPTKAVKINRHVFFFFFHYHTYTLCPAYMGDTRKCTENQTTPIYQVRKETHYT